ncbi:MAG: 50S ribosomal protein L6 [Omnitrophica WOR_2 bacterium GWA2_47_8]|nr:MAG: 50S ribosomal protein L6 [Omnitrophica WOR_2 bacterium GWA2_47_8]
MSRMGKIPVPVPKEVKLAISASSVQVEGPKGKLSLAIPYGIKVEQKDNVLNVHRNADTKQNRANHGSVRSILENMVAGVTQGHKKSLEIQGVGFRAQLNGDTLTLNLGFSHSVEYKVPKTVKVSVPKPTDIIIEGPDKCAVGHVASEIRAFKKPEPYKGKGIRYSGEAVRRKQGKSVTK